MAAGGAEGKKNGEKSPSKRCKTNLKTIHRPVKNKPIKKYLAGLISSMASSTTASHNFLTQNDHRLVPSQTLALESEISSTSVSLSELFSLLRPIALPGPKYRPPSATTPPSCWFSRFLSAASAVDDPRWVEAFRMSKPHFTLLLRILTSSLKSLSPIPPNYALAAALFRLSHGASYKSVGRRFMMDAPTACRAFYMVCKAINDQLGNLFEFASDIKRISVGFRWNSLPNCCGVLGFDEYQIEGDLLGENGSLVVQALVDSEGRFLDVSAGWPNTMKPETILLQSKLYSNVEVTRELLDGPCLELNNGSLLPQYILGDSCCPLLPWLITPYDKNKTVLNSFEMAFNNAHSRAMELVSTAFGRVRARWKLLSQPWKEGCVESFPFVIVSCYLLHNFLMRCSQAMPEEEEVKKHLGKKQEPEEAFEGEVDENGQRVRDVLALHLNGVSHRR